MTDNVDYSRARRPIPERTRPNRGILGAFGQRDVGTMEDGHPLGPGFADAPAFDDQAVREASDLVDRHIREGEEIAAEDKSFDAAGWLGGLAQSPELAGVVTQASRAYSEILSIWVELAGGLRDQVMQPRGKPQAAGPVGSVPLAIRAAVPVEAQVEMFRTGEIARVQPLGADDPAQTSRITDVGMNGDKLRVAVPADQAAGTYRGLLLGDGSAPLGVLTVQVFAPDGGGS